MSAQTPLIYHMVQPETSPGATNGFREFNTLSFVLSADGRKYVKNSLVLEFKVKAYSDAYTTRVTRANRIGIENKIGGHAFCDSWTCEVQSAGVIAQHNEYPRYVNMINSSSRNINDVADAKSQAEHIGATVQNGRYDIQAVNSNNSNANDTTITYDNDFSIQPKIVFNQMSGDDYSFSKNGNIRISMNLAKNNNALFGANGAAASYEIVDPVLRFQSVPDDGSQGMMMLNSYSVIKNSINSTMANISARVPVDKCSGVAISYLEQAHENDPVRNSYKLEKIPLWKSIQYLFNNSTSEYVSYKQEDRDSSVIMGLQALQNDLSGTQCNAQNLRANEGFIQGLPFEEFIDLRSQTFNVNVESDSQQLTNNPRLIYLYFMSLIQL